MSGMITSTEQQIKWDLRMLELAKHVSDWSKDTSTRVGAVIAHGKKILSVGYNGFPADVEDNPEWYNDRDKKLSLIVHAELNAWETINRAWLYKCTLYTYPFLPCSDCAKEFIGSGLTRVVAPRNKVERWQKSLDESTELFTSKGVAVDDLYEEVCIEHFEEVYYEIRRIQS